MMTRADRVLALFLIYCTLMGRAVHAQQLTVFITHDPPGGGRSVDESMRYQPPGMRTADTLAGRPADIKVREGQQVCYVVLGANPLLYSYSVGKTVVPVKVAEGLDPILDALQTLLGSAPGTGARHSATPGNGEEDFRSIVRRIALDDLEQIAALRTASDGESDFKRSADAARTLFEAARKDSVEAVRIYSTMDDATKSNVADLRVLLLMAMDRLRNQHQEFVEARKLLDKPMCITMGTDRIRTYLEVHPRELASGQVQARRQVSKDNEALAAVEIDPDVRTEVAVGPGVFVAGLVGGDRRLGVDAAGKVTDLPSSQTYVRTGVFLTARATERVWGAVAVAKGEAAAPDFFFGVLFKFGSVPLGTALTLGTGYTLMQVPVSVQGASQGDALPEGKDLKDLIQREYRGGLGLTFALTGLKIDLRK